jgi:hypothetical protein
MSTYNLVTRAQWNARPPTRTVLLNWNKVDKFIVHYSGAVRTQSVRSIQNYCMDSKGHSDIDYNDLVRGRDRYIGRGVNEGSHTLNQNATSYGVCVIGNDGDATDDDLRVVREIYDEVCAKLGRQLRKLGHRTAMPPGYTDCPGNEIQAWIDKGMPYPEGLDDMYEQNDRDVNTADTWRLVTLLENMDEAVYKLPNEATARHEPNLLKKQLDRIEAALAAGGPATGISEDRLRQIVREEIAKTKLT